VLSRALKAFTPLAKRDFNEIETIIAVGECLRKFYFIPNERGFDALKICTLFGEDQ